MIQTWGLQATAPKRHRIVYKVHSRPSGIGRIALSESISPLRSLHRPCGLDPAPICFAYPSTISAPTACLLQPGSLEVTLVQRRALRCDRPCARSRVSLARRRMGLIRIGNDTYTVSDERRSSVCVKHEIFRPGNIRNQPQRILHLHPQRRRDRRGAAWRCVSCKCGCLPQRSELLWSGIFHPRRTVAST